MIYDEPTQSGDYEKKAKDERREALSRLLSLGGNPVVAETKSRLKKAVEDQDKLRKDWDPVNRLVETANDMYRRGELGLNESIAHLATSLTDLSKGKKGETRETKREKEETDEVEGRGRQEVLTRLQTTPAIEVAPVD